MSDASEMSPFATVDPAGREYTPEPFLDMVASLSKKWLPAPPPDSGAVGVDVTRWPSGLRSG